jgi:hypothetical protein
MARALVGQLADAVDPETVRVAQLLASELLTMCVRDEGDEDDVLELEIRLGEEQLRVQVVGESKRFAFARADADMADLALSLLDELADRWGLSRTRRGTICWVEIDCWGRPDRVHALLNKSGAAGG